MNISNKELVYIEQDEIKLNDVIAYISGELEKNRLLANNVDNIMFKKRNVKSYGKFEDDFWAFYNHLSGTYAYFDFREISVKKAFNSSVHLSIEETRRNRALTVKLVKCWIGNNIIEQYYKNENTDTNINFASMRSCFTFFVEFLNYSSFLLNNYVEHMDSFIDSIGSPSGRKKTASLFTDYLMYAITFLVDKKKETYLSYLEKVKYISETLKVAIGVRELPDAKDIYHFANYIESFFFDKNTDEDLINYYYPILLWWKITTVIPMRPGEFCTALKRDCLSKVNGKYYFAINRLKARPCKKYKALPILKQIEVPKELYEMVKHYIKITDYYGISKTLISYHALIAFRLKLTIKYKKAFQVGNTSVKSFKNTFSLPVFNAMLESFNNYVIKEHFNDTYINKNILPGDTRHIAFTSLIMQGYSPTEVAILGGHRTLKTLDNYTSSANIYQNSAIMTFKRHVNGEPIVLRQNLFDKIMSMPAECPKQIENCFISYIYGEPFGYCTGSFGSDSFPCENKECYKCSKWWCEPKRENYFLIKKILNPEDKTTYKDNREKSVEFMKILLDKSGVILNTLKGE